MHIGIKFCGGCNPAYDRGATCARIKKAFAVRSRASGAEACGDEDDGPIRFSWAEPGPHYDILLVISGCSARCADISDYRFDHTVSLWRGDGVPKAVAEIGALTGLKPTNSEE